MQKAARLLKIFAILAALIVATIVAPEHKVAGVLFVAAIVAISALGQARAYLQKLIAPKSYACVFEKDIFAANGKKIVGFEIEYSLPFAPFVGLAVGGHLNTLPEGDNINPANHDSKSFFTGEIVSIRWVFSRFLCTVSPHRIAEGEALEEIIITLSNQSWVLQDLYFKEGAQVLEYINRIVSNQPTATTSANGNKYIRAKAMLEAAPPI